MHRRRILYLFLFLTIGLLVICYCLFRDQLLIHLSPQAALHAAIKTTAAQLEMRFADTPCAGILEIINTEGQYEAEFSLAAEDAPVDSWVGKIYIDGSNKRLRSEGDVVYKGKEISGSIYADSDAIAYCADKNSNDGFLGVTFRSFSEDIQKMDIMNIFLSDQTLQTIELGLQQIKQVVNTDFFPIPAPLTEQDNLQKIFLAMMTFPCDTTRTTVALDGNAVNCLEISFTLDPRAAGNYIQDPSVIKFYLNNGQLIKMQLQSLAEGENALFSVVLGKDPQKNTIRISYKEIDIEINREDCNGEHTESAMVSGLSDHVYCITSNAATGMIHVYPDEPQKQNRLMDFHFTRLGKAMQVQSSDYSELFQLIFPEMFDENGAYSISGSIVLAKGAAVPKQSYKNLDQWTAEDLLVIFQNLGVFLEIP